ncbi:hypothetical protein BDV27DRAFT_75954 [Aspergillus caelatus]|uniref:Uncharacterized protein n=1 Tax=Aspergillus caelatus TaxID=61420 RepID=A0A5N7ABL2_9EURO|nr:uncharacterized protein BDV27DRAFT_75954 [Aspergillus caelatus]KAE8367244.1 hypothetical protein BDV27DRAFT_75954 [Aspergillus caelatus]
MLRLETTCLQSSNRKLWTRPNFQRIRVFLAFPALQWLLHEYPTLPITGEGLTAKGWKTNPTQSWKEKGDLVLIDATSYHALQFVFPIVFGVEGEAYHHGPVSSGGPYVVSSRCGTLPRTLSPPLYLQVHGK